jgi:hypothetical protein
MSARTVELTSDGVAERERRGKMSVTTGKLSMIGTSGPIDADGKGPQRARQASSMGIGREGAICEEIEIMCKSSPVRATMRGL